MGKWDIGDVPYKDDPVTGNRYNEPLHAEHRRSTQLTDGLSLAA